MLKRSIPISAATLTTSRFVDVPMVVAMPPTMLAKPIGISVPDGDIPVLTATPISMGSINTTIGVLLINALRKAVINNVSNKDMAGLRRQDLASIRPIGSSAPVLIRPWPTIISAQTASFAAQQDALVSLYTFLLASADFQRAVSFFPSTKSEAEVDEFAAFIRDRMEAIESR